MSNKVKVTIYIAIMVIALSVTAALYVLMPACDDCGRKICFGNCVGEGGWFGLQDDQTVRLPGAKTNQKTTLLAETEAVDPAEYFETVWLIGDSRTNALQLYDIPVDRIFAQDGLNQEQALSTAFLRIGDSKPVTIPEAVMYAAPEVMIVNFGINGIAWWSTEQFMESYDALITALKEASPGSIIVIESVLPVAQSYEESAESNGLTNERIDEINELLYRYAQQNGCYYMATGEVMKNEENDLKEEYSDDGLHFTRAGYQAVIDYILTHAVIREK